MIFFKKRKRLEISNHITAVDGKVIARRGDRIDGNFLENLVSSKMMPANSDYSLENTPFFNNFEVLLNEPKYSFISSDSENKDHLLAILAPIELNDMFVKELNYMKRQPYHFHHTLAITALVTRITYDLYHDEAKARNAASCALTHDFGILRVSGSILNKVSPLNKTETKIVWEHPIYSYILLAYYLGDSENLHSCIGLEHHENLLGSGYPRGIVQEQVVSQFIQICDIFDALITARPFRPAMPVKNALKIMRDDVKEGKLNAGAFDLLNSCLRNVSKNETLSHN